MLRMTLIRMMINEAFVKTRNDIQTLLYTSTAKLTSHKIGPFTLVLYRGANLTTRFGQAPRENPPVQGYGHHFVLQKSIR